MIFHSIFYRIFANTVPNSFLIFFFCHKTHFNSKEEKKWRTSLTFWSHICRKTFCKSTCLALISSWYIDHTFSTLFTCVFQISAEIESKTKRNRWYFDLIAYSAEIWVEFCFLNSSREKLTVVYFVWKIHGNRHMMVHHNAFQMLDRRILCNGCLCHEVSLLSFFARTLHLIWL